MIDRQTIESKAKELENAVTQTQETVKSVAMMTAIGVGAVVVLAYLMGRRRGKKGGARIEIHKL
jgi:hypothetical protein